MHFSNSALSKYVDHADVIVFDLNGLIIDDEPVMLLATNEAMRDFDVSISEAEWIERCVGRKAQEYLASFCSSFADQGELTRAVGRRDRIYQDKMNGRALDFVRIGVLEFLHAIRTGGKTAAVASSTTRAGVEAILGRANLGIANEFDLIVCGDDVEKAKPHPEIYERVRTEFGAGENYLVFEDANAGARAAKAAQMLCVAVPNRFTAAHDFSMCDAVATDFTKDSRVTLPERDQHNEA